VRYETTLRRPATTRCSARHGLHTPNRPRTSRSLAHVAPGSFFLPSHLIAPPSPSVQPDTVALVPSTDTLARPHIAPPLLRISACRTPLPRLRLPSLSCMLLRLSRLAILPTRVAAAPARPDSEAPRRRDRRVVASPPSRSLKQPSASPLERPTNALLPCYGRASDQERPRRQAVVAAPAERQLRLPGRPRAVTRPKHELAPWPVDRLDRGPTAAPEGTSFRIYGEGSLSVRADQMHPLAALSAQADVARPFQAAHGIALRQLDRPDARRLGDIILDLGP
jgi:hypothetical protein